MRALFLMHIMAFSAGTGGVEEMEDVEAIHRAYLTPAHKRKGKGGRQPAADPRLDPGIDPKRARRILANRLSAARSKMKQKSHVEVGLLSTHTVPTPLIWSASAAVCALSGTRIRQRDHHPRDTPSALKENKKEDKRRPGPQGMCMEAKTGSV